MNVLIEGHPYENGEPVNYIWVVIQKTEAWLKVKHATKVEESIIKERDPASRLDYINAFGSLLGRKFRYYDDLIKYVKKQAEHLRNHIMRHAAEFANEYLVELNVPRLKEASILVPIISSRMTILIILVW